MSDGQRLQIYAPTSNRVTPFWREKYERDAKKYWDIFYKRHQDKFFKDRHYLDKEWGRYFGAEGKKVILEVGCGAGNTIFPLVALFPDIFVYACDFSPRAVDLIKAHKDFEEERVSAFVCDLTVDDLCEKITPSSVDIVTMVFVLSAIAPEKMPLVLQNIRKVLKPNGHVLLRDYAIGDLAQERLTNKDQEISENFYVRGDGTRAFYFSEDFLTSLFKTNGFDLDEVGMCCKQVENRARELVMNRRWIQSVFHSSYSPDSATVPESEEKIGLHGQESKLYLKHGDNSKEPANCTEIDISESIVFDMFGLSQSTDEVMELNLGDLRFKIKVLSREFQHTCKSTGLMLWESAHVMSVVLAENPSITSNKRVLELGCGSTGICSMLAVRYADLVVATDGDPKAMELLSHNVSMNLEPDFFNKLVIKRLEWGNQDHIEAVKELNHEGFDVIIGTDVTYIPEAIAPLFETARLLISNGRSGEPRPSLILCHVVRRVDEASILSAASHFGFRLVDRWDMGASKAETFTEGLNQKMDGEIISSWFSTSKCNSNSKTLELNSAVNILYFQV